MQLDGLKVIALVTSSATGWSENYLEVQWGGFNTIPDSARLKVAWWCNGGSIELLNFDY